MAYDIEQCGDVEVVHIDGRLGLAEGTSLETDLVARVDDGQKLIVFDLSRTTFLTSDGVAVILATWERARAADGWVRIACPSKPIREIFVKTNLDRVFEICDDLDAALGREQLPKSPS